MMLTDLADAARKSGLPVIERPKWRTRGHGSTGIRGVRTIVCHHTAGPKTGNSPSLNYIETKVLSQIVLARDGSVIIVAAGLCYHAGVVHSIDYSNSWSIGIEAEATGIDPWPAVQYNAYVRLVKALADHYRVPLSRVLGHKEVAAPSGRKSDPNFDMNEFRDRVKELGNPTPAPPPNPTPDGRRILRQGVPAGTDIWDLQAFLNRVFPSYCNIQISAKRTNSPFGPQTHAAVTEFQRRTRLTADGIVGPNTYRELAKFGFK